MQDQEQWKDIPGYEGLYRVSTLGNVWSCRNHKQLQTSTTTNGYRQASFCVARCFKSYWVHRLVAQAWLPEPEGIAGRAVVDHINFDRTDNRVENLRWVSYRDNNRHTIDNQRHYTKRGSERKTAKLTDEQVLALRSQYAAGGVTMRELAEEYGIAQCTVSKIVHHQKWTHL